MKTKIFLLLLIFNFASCNYLFQLKSDNNLTKLLEKEINSNPEKIKFVKITDFEWDTLLILEPYSWIEKHEKSLNVDMSNIRENGIRLSDSFNLLVFIKDGKSVKISQLSRANGDFNDYEILIPKAKAIFVKDQKRLLKLSK
ncbi:hypothetical protein [Flavobacterium sp. ZB4P13]|uniref:hypothetical protein n=1 Tax=Flavobacterium sp. ZB4P13 TaxID=3401728 RepID=UPI003AAA23AD